jgi:diguanylate cyclase (GGDEF)-like protein
MLFLDRLAQAIVRCRREKSMAAVMFIDLDNFKPINDSMGHAIGDQILKRVAGRLSSCMRETDTVARFGGDEFVVLMTDLKNSKAPPQMAQKLKVVLAEPINLDNNEYVLGASIGIALYPEHGNTPDELIALADEAMYEAKKKTKNGYQYAVVTD